MRDPDAAAGAHHRLHRRHEPAGRALRLDLAVLPARGSPARGSRRRRAGAAEPQLDELLEPLLGPQGLAGQPQRRLLLGGRARPLQAPREDRDLAGQGAEEALVRQLGRLDAAPRRSALVQRAILASGWVTLMRTTRSAITRGRPRARGSGSRCSSSGPTPPARAGGRRGRSPARPTGRSSRTIGVGVHVARRAADPCGSRSAPPPR